MNNQKAITFIAGFFLLIFSLTAISAEPTLQSVQATATAQDKIKEIVFLYQERNLSRTQQSNYGSASYNPNRAFLGDTGFMNFGDLLVVSAKQTLSTHGFPVIHAGYAPEGRLAEYKSNLNDLLGSQLIEATYVILAPVSAMVVSTAIGLSRIEVVLAVEITDIASGRSIWKGQVDTSTRIGKGFIGANLFNKTSYDDAYAQAIFDLLGQAWVKAGLLRTGN